MSNVEGRWSVISELQATGLDATRIRPLLTEAENTGRATYQASRHLTYTVTWTEADGYQVTETDTSPADWTIAYRKPTASRFQRVTDWAGTWRQASAKAGEFAEAHPGLQVWYVPTAAYEAAHPGSEDNGNILTGTGRRVRITDDGTIAGPDAETIRTMPDIMEDWRRREAEDRSALSGLGEPHTVTAPAARPPGHPRHQLRTFTVTARKAGSRAGRLHVTAQTEHDAILRAGRLHVTAQTEHDAILRAGLTLARKYPGTDAQAWHVTGVHDPAPATWSPAEQETSKS